MNESTEQLIHIVRDFFAGRHDVAAVYLYGSAVHGPFTQYSDVDVGVLYEREHVPDFEQQMDDSMELSNRLRREVDLVVLNNVSPILQRQVLKKGRMILCQNPKLVNRFFVNALNSYFDLKRNRREIERNLYQVSIYD